MRCGDGLPLWARSCGRCGTLATPRTRPTDDAPLPTFQDTIQIPGAEHARPPKPRVRPALAVLFRVAVGPGADYYAPRFLKYEQVGHGAPGWNWPSFLFPSFWAFYRKLWLEGILFALLPIAGAMVFANLGPQLDEARVPWVAAALLLTWLLPGIPPALIANSLLYRRVRRVVRSAESRTASAAKVVSLLATRSPTSLVAALLLSAGWPARRCALPIWSTTCASGSQRDSRRCGHCRSRSRTAGIRFARFPAGSNTTT
jgi:hypothetical protein